MDWKKNNLNGNENENESESLAYNLSQFTRVNLFLWALCTGNGTAVKARLGKVYSDKRHDLNVKIRIAATETVSVLVRVRCAPTSDQIVY